MAITASISEPPWPPSASGMVMPISPCWLISLATSNGNRASWARLSASFSRCACANLRTAVGEQLLLFGEIEIHAA